MIDAPLVMSLCASVRNVESDPPAFWMMMSDAGTPAASNAFFSIGWSNSTYRVELVVSGRIAATFPLPLAPSGFSTFSAVNVLLNELAEIVGVPLDELELALLVALLVALPLPAA